MNARLLIAIALVVCAVVGVRADEETSVETVEPTFLEADAVAEDGGFPFSLPKKMEKTTVEPRYYGESAKKPKKYVSPEYRDPQPKKLTRKQRKLAPVTFTSHYFSPLPPKKKDGKNLKAKRSKKNRSLVPFRATVETPAGHQQHKGFQTAELWDGRLPNKYDDPRQNMKKTKAPAPQISFVEFDAEVDAEGEVDTTEAMEADAEAEGPVPPPFQHDEGEIQATVVEAEEFFDANHQAPTWADEEATETEMSAIEADAAATEAQVELDLTKLPRLVPIQPHVSAEDAVEQYEELQAFLESADSATASFVEIDAEEETEEEAEEETEDEAEDEAEDQDEAEDEAEGIALVEAAADADSVDAEMDEMAQNELAASQVDMDATSDEAAMTEDAESEEEVEEETVVEDMDADEESSAEEADTTEEVIEDEEAVEDAENAMTVALVEEASDAEDVESLLNEVDAETDTETEGESESDAEKGTPGHSISAGQTWEDAQTARLNALQSQLDAEKASTPKVTAAVVSKEELHAGEPEYNSVEARVETVEPELLVETAGASAQTVLLEKIAKLKAIRRA